MPQIHARTCHICEANCGLLVETEGREILSIKGNPDHVLSQGHICPKGTAIADLQNDPDRLHKPVKKVNGTWVEMEWEAAFAEIAQRLSAIKAKGGKRAMYLGNPTAHDYGVTTQIGALKKAVEVENIYSASTLDQIPHHAAQLQMYGHGSLAAIPDIDRCQYLVVVGGNPAASNGSLWTVPGFKKRAKKMQARGGKLVVIDPRRTETAKLADDHHFIKPGTDTALFLGILKEIFAKDVELPKSLANLLDDSWKFIAPALDAFDTSALAEHCGISHEDIRAIADQMTSGQSASLYGRIGISVCAFGTLNRWLIEVINIASGNLDKIGGTMVPEPGVDVINVIGRGTSAEVKTNRGVMPSILGEIPTITLAEEMVRDDEEQIKALFVVMGNPVLSAPDGVRLDKAMQELELMVSIDMYVTETSRHSDFILPPCGPLQKDHFPIFFGALSIRNCASYSPAIFDMEEGEKADWEIITELSRAILSAEGKDIPNIRHPRDVLDQMLRSSPAGLTLEEVENQPNGVDLGPLRPCMAERIKTENKKIHAAPAPFLNDLNRFRDAMNAKKGDSMTLIGRRHVRSNNSWLHNSKRLLKGPDRCTMMIHPDDAEQRGLVEGDIAVVASRVNSLEIPIEITEDVMPGVVSIPHGFGHGREGVGLSVASAKPGVSLNDLTDPAHFDPLSGNAVLNGTPVTIEKASEIVVAE